MSGAYATKTINVMNNVDAGAIGDLLNMSGRLNVASFEQGLDVLTRVKNASTQSDLLAEATYLNRQNLEWGVDLMTEVKTDTVEQMVEVSKGLTQAKSKNQLTNQLYRIRNFTQTEVRGAVFGGSAYGCCRGSRKRRALKRRWGRGREITGTTIYPYTPPALKAESSAARVERVENLIQKSARHRG